MTFTDIDWATSTNDGFTINGATVTPTHTSAAWDNHVRSADEWVAGDEPKLKFTSTNADSFNCGLAYDPLTSSTTYSAIEYGVHVNDEGTAYAYASGSNLDTLATGCDSSTVYEIRLTTTGVKWYVDGVLEHSITSTFGTTVFYAQCTVKSVGTAVTAEYEDGSIANQELKIMFYPDNNVQDETGTTTSTGFKWWFGMRGKKKYGRSRIINVRW